MKGSFWSYLKTFRSVFLAHGDKQHNLTAQNKPKHKIKLDELKLSKVY